MFANNTKKEVQDKLIILFILNEFDMPLNQSQLTDFILDMNLMNFFTASQYINEIYDKNFLLYLDSTEPAMYLIGKEGKNTLDIFQDRLPNQLCENIKEKIKIYKSKFAQEREINAQYNKKIDTENEFEVNLKLFESGDPLMNLSFTVFSQNKAKKICTSWRKNATKYYSQLLEILESNPEQENNTKNTSSKEQP